MAALALLPAALRAALTVGPASTLQTFDTTPPVGDWSTLSVTSGVWSNAAAVDAAVATLNAATVVNALRISAIVPPAANALAQHNSTLRLLQTKPTGNRGLYLMATLTNGAGGVLAVAQHSRGSQSENDAQDQQQPVERVAAG